MTVDRPRWETAARIRVLRLRASVIAACVSLAASLADVALAGTPGPVPTTTAERALDTCNAVGDRPTWEAREQLTRGLALAEEAVAADERNAKARLAVFCNLAKLTYLNGFSLRSLVAVWRLRREIDTALEIDPNYSAALVAKGSFLLNLPDFLGGDPHEAERVLRHAVELDPDWALARLHLAKALVAVGARDQAAAQAQHALEIAERKGRSPQADDARTLIARLRQ